MNSLEYPDPVKIVAGSPLIQEKSHIYIFQCLGLNICKQSRKIEILYIIFGKLNKYWEKINRFQNFSDPDPDP